MKVQLNIQVDKEVREGLKDLAKSCDRSINWYANKILSDHILSSKTQSTASPKPAAKKKPVPHKAVDANSVITIPDYIDGGTWLAFMEARKGLKAPSTEYAINSLLTKLERMHLKGIDVNDVIATSVENGWKGVFEPKGRNATITRPCELGDF